MMNRIHAINLLASRFPVFPVTGDDIYALAAQNERERRQAKLERLGKNLADLRQEAARLRNLRRNRAASLIEAELQTVINEILAMGPTA